MKIQRPLDRRFSQPTEEVGRMIEQLETLPEGEIEAYLGGLPEWKHGKTDLLYWMDVLNRFDELLEGVVKEYNLGALQNKEFTQQDRGMVREILRFQKVLVENGSNKSIFNSFDTVEPFIYSYELDLAIEALFLICFFASKIHNQRSIKTNMAHMNMDNLRVVLNQVGNKSCKTFVYYDEQTGAAKKIDLGKWIKKDVYRVSEKIVPKSELRSLAHTLRCLYLIGTWNKLVIIKLLAFGTIVYYKHTDLSIDSEFINKELVEILDFLRDEDFRVREAALVMIDALFRMRIRHSALISIMETHLPDGMIMRLLRQVIDTPMPEHFVVAFFSLLSSFFASAQGASALYSAGVVEYICFTLKHRKDVGYRMKSRLVMCANTFLFTITAPFPRFLSERGMCILAEELLLSARKTIEEPEGDNYNLLCYVKSIMKITSQLFQNAGTAEAMHGFLEGAFPRAIQLILQHPGHFQPSILAYLFSSVANYIHAEPSNLSFVVEAGIFDGFLHVMERPFPPSADFLADVPTAIEAFLLSPELSQRMEEKKIIGKMFMCFEAQELCDVFTSHDLASNYGLFLEKIIRYYPGMVGTVREAMHATAKCIKESIPHRSPELTNALLENLFRAISCMIYNTSQSNYHLEEGLLGRVINILAHVELSVESELYTLSMEILKKVLADYKTNIVEYFFVHLERILHEKKTEQAQQLKRMLFVANNILFSGPKDSQAHSSSFLEFAPVAVLGRINAVVLEEQAETRAYFFNLFYSFTLCLLKHLEPAEEAGKTRLEDNQLEHSAISVYLVQLSVGNLQDTDVHDRALLAHLTAIKNYITLDLDKNTRKLALETQKAFVKSRLVPVIHRKLQDVVRAVHEKNTSSPLSKNKAEKGHAKEVSELLDTLAAFVTGVQGHFTEHAEKEEEEMYSTMSNGMGNGMSNGMSGTMGSTMGNGMSSTTMDTMSMSIRNAGGAGSVGYGDRGAPYELENETLQILKLVYPILSARDTEYVLSVGEVILGVSQARKETEAEIDTGMGRARVSVHTSPEYRAITEKASELMLQLLSEKLEFGSAENARVELFLQLTQEGASAEHLYNQRSFYVLAKIAAKEKKGFLFLQRKLPEMAQEIRTSEDPRLLQLFGVTLMISSVYAEFDRCTDRSVRPCTEAMKEDTRADGVDRADRPDGVDRAETTILFEDSGRSLSLELVEARLLVALAVKKVRLEGYRAYTIRDVDKLIVQGLGVLSQEGHEQGSKHTLLLQLLSLAGRRATESKEAIAEHFKMYLHAKYYARRKESTIPAFCLQHARMLGYNMQAFLSVVGSLFEKVSSGDIRYNTEQERKTEDAGENPVLFSGILHPDFLSRKVRTYPDVDPSVYRTLLQTCCAQHSKTEKIQRIQMASSLLFSFPQLAGVLEAHEYVWMLFFLEEYLEHKTLHKDQAGLKKGTEETEMLAHWAGQTLVVLFNNTEEAPLKRYVLQHVLQAMGRSGHAAQVASYLLQKILAARFNKHMFNENLELLKKENVVVKLVDIMAGIDPRTKDYSHTVESISNTLEYITRVLQLSKEKDAFYENIKPFDGTSSEESEGYMEDFDTDETVDSDRSDYLTEEEESREMDMSYTSEEGSHEYRSSDSQTNERYINTDVHMQPFGYEESPLGEGLEMAPGIEDDPVLASSMSVGTVARAFAEEAGILKDLQSVSFLTQIIQTYIVPGLSTLPLALEKEEEEEEEEEGEEEEEEAPSPSVSMSESSDTVTEEESEDFASDEEVFLGDENGDVPQMDPEVLNSLPDDILQDTVSQFYRERISSSTQYRPISTHFLDRLSNRACRVFEEEELGYFELFNTERRAEPVRKKVQAPEKVYFSSIREEMEIVPKDVTMSLIDMIFHCSYRKILYKIVHNLASSQQLRYSIVQSLVKNVSHGSIYNKLDKHSKNMVTRRSLEALTYLCSRSEDWVYVFCTHAYLFSELFSGISKRSLSDMLRLLGVLSVCFQSRKMEQVGAVEIEKFFHVLKLDIQEEMFEHMEAFVTASSAYFKQEYLAYLTENAYEILDSMDKEKTDILTSEGQKIANKFVYLLTLVSDLGASPSVFPCLWQIRRHPFWVEFFYSTLVKNRKSAVLQSYLPIFKGFLLAYRMRVHTETSAAASTNAGTSTNPNTSTSTSTITSTSAKTRRHAEPVYVELGEEQEFYNEVIEKEKELFNHFLTNDPELMFRSFAGLSPKVLDFDNKRRFFYKNIENSARSRMPVVITLSRETLFEDTFHQIMKYSGTEIRESAFNVRFEQEEGVDVGGLTREWYVELGKEMFNPNYGLFVPVGSFYHPSAHSHINPEHLLYFKFIGRVIGKAVHDRVCLDCHFTRGFYKYLLGVPPEVSDIEAFDAEFYRSLTWILENSIDGVLDLTFSIEQETFGMVEIVDLIPGGKHIGVTDQNKREYIDLICQFKLVRIVERQMSAFADGFFEILNRKKVGIFNEKELELLISGLPEIDVDDWKNNTVYSGYTASSQVVRWFWRAVRHFSMEERAKLLQFATSTSKLPLEGFAGLRCQNGFQKFQIVKAPGDNSRLPTARTCFNQLELPEYTEYEVLIKNLLYSFEECSTGFGFA
ncbi:E3 ubiquitin-protein ligase HUWE1 [Nematocida sp. AWRm77]|nr:E3 ubiquitin-protein ligase HUWE1 [Nematocida sp. AWRm77]